MEKWCILPHNLVSELSIEGNMVLESLARFCNTTTKNLLEVLIQRNTPPKYEEDKHEEDDKSNPRDYFAFGYKKYRKKVNNKVRELREPIPKLKVIQNTIRDRLLSIPVSLTSMAGKKKDSAEKNAELHRYNPYLITLDIKNAYPSITTHRVYKNLEGSLWNALDIRAPLLTTDEKTTTANNKKLFISALTHLCVSEDELPQGAPTSNQIQNIVMRGFDTKIEKKLPELSCSHLIYSRYADDITLSFLHYTTKDVLEEKFSYYLNKSKKADSETLEVLLQQFEKEKFVATDNFERKYITEKIDEFREIIQHLPLSWTNKYSAIGKINAYKQQIIASDWRIDQIKDELISIIGQEWRKINPKKIHTRTPQSDTEREINGIVFDNAGNRSLNRKTQGQYKRLFKELTTSTLTELANNHYYQKKFRIKTSTTWSNQYEEQEVSIGKIKNTLKGVYNRLKQVYGSDRVPKEFTELFNQAMEKRDTYDSWLLDPKRTEEKVKKQEQKKEKESFLKKDKQEYYETMGVQWEIEDDLPF